MKFTEALFRHYKPVKYTTNEKKVRFRPEMRMELRNSVAGNKQKFSNNACIQEMFMMMACLKKNEFDQAMCTDDIRKYRSCNDAYFADRSQKELNARTGKITPGLKEFSAPQVNTLLTKYPVK